jgi:hypothetical protein
MGLDQATKDRMDEYVRLLSRSAEHDLPNARARRAMGSDLRAVLAALDEAEARAEWVERERDAITRLGYYPDERGFHWVWNLCVDPLDGSTPEQTKFFREEEAIAAVRKAAGLEDAKDG